MINKQICFYSLALILAAIAINCFAITNQNFGVSQKTTVLAIPIDPNQVSPYVITDPGCYKLTNNMTDFQIIIEASDVALLFNGYSINNPTLQDHAIIINPGLSDIIIQGGFIAGNNLTTTYGPVVSGIFINDNCTNIFVTSLEIRNQSAGVYCVPGTGSFNTLIMENNFINCNFGVTASNQVGLRIKQNTFSAPSQTQAEGIRLANCVGSTIDECTITKVVTGIFIGGCNATDVRNTVISKLVGGFAGINAESGTSTMIENCLVNDFTVTAISSADMGGIRLFFETKSSVKNCVVNYMHPVAGNTGFSYGIGVINPIGAPDNNVVQDNEVSNIFNNTVNPSYGYFLFESSGTSTFATIVNNRAKNCNNPNVIPFEPSIPNVVTIPQANQYLWNWALP